MIYVYIYIYIYYVYTIYIYILTGLETLHTPYFKRTDFTGSFLTSSAVQRFISICSEKCGSCLTGSAVQRFIFDWFRFWLVQRFSGSFLNMLIKNGSFSEQAKTCVFIVGLPTQSTN